MTRLRTTLACLAYMAAVYALAVLALNPPHWS